MKLNLLIFCCLLDLIVGGPHQRRLLKHLFIEQEYNKLERPAKNDSDPVSVTIGLSLVQILDFDVNQQFLTTNVWLTMKWYDYNMIWEPENYGNITEIHIPTTKLWIPDVVLYNSLNENCNNPPEVNMVVQSTGEILYVSQRILKSSCGTQLKSVSSVSIYYDYFQMNIFVLFLVNTHSCSLKFGSWSADTSEIQLELLGEQIDLTSYIDNSEWNIKNTSAVLSSQKYECCPEIYDSITYKIELIHRFIENFPNVNSIEKNNNKGKVSNKENTE